MAYSTKWGPIDCPYCGKTHKGRPGLNSHMKYQHDEETMTTVGCTWCGDDVTVREWETDERHWCHDTNCSKLWQIFLRTGSRNANYTGKSNYRGQDYKYRKMSIRFRDDECCQVQTCGRSETENRDQFGANLSVHHITPEDDIESNDPHRPTNLITVCHKCHPTLENCSEREQLKRIGVKSRKELELPDDIRTWYKNMIKERKYDGPDPCLEMFAEAQRMIENRDGENSDYCSPA